MPNPSPAQLITLRRQMKELNDLDPSMALTTAMAFVEVAYKHPEPVSSMEISQLLDIEYSGPTRVMDLLTTRGRKGRNKEGLGLVEDYPDEEDRRRRLYRLTDAGKRALKRLLKKQN